MIISVTTTFSPAALTHSAFISKAFVYSTAKAGVMIMANGNNGIVRMNNKYLSKVRAAIMLIDNIKNERVMINTLGVSGILNKARSLFGKKPREKIAFRKNLEGKQESSQRRAFS